MQRVDCRQRTCATAFSLKKSEQGRIVRAAEAEAWTVERLRAEIARSRPERSERGGRRRTPPVQKTLRMLKECVDEANGSFKGVDIPSQDLSFEQATEALAMVSMLQRACSQLEERARGILAAPHQQAPDAHASGVCQLGVAARPNILIVEDHAPMGRQLHTLASLHGEVIATETVEQAFGVLGDWTVNLDAAIVDLHLRDGCGLDVLVWFRDRFREAGALMVTGQLTAEAEEVLRDVRAEILEKPFPSDSIHQFLELAGLPRQGPLPSLAKVAALHETDMQDAAAQSA